MKQTIYAALLGVAASLIGLSAMAAPPTSDATELILADPNMIELDGAMELDGAIEVQAQADAPRDISRDMIAAKLAELGEHQAAIGLTRAGSLFELYVSPDGKWTAVMTSPAHGSYVAERGYAFTARVPPD